MISYLYDVSNIYTYLNFLVKEDQPEIYYYNQYLKLGPVKEAIHSGNRNFGEQTGSVRRYLNDDDMKSVKPWIEDILNAGIKTIFYNGHLDIIIPFPKTVQFLNELNWEHREEFRNASRQIWRLGENLAGYAVQYGALSLVMVHASGHMVPHDQPEAGLDLVNKFITGDKFGL